MGDQADGHTVRDDPWMSSVTSVSAFLAGFSLAAVVVIASTAGSFRWPGVAVLALTVGSVTLVAAAQGSRRGAYYYEDYRAGMRMVIWVEYHGGIVALLVGLGAALVPRDGVGGQQALRWVAACVAFAAAALEAGVGVATLARLNSDTASLGNRRWPPWSSVRRAEVAAQDGERR